MTTEADFHAALNEEPSNSSMRLVFADFLEERGDWRSYGMRWMGENRKWPLNYVLCWWWWHDAYDKASENPHCVLFGKSELIKLGLFHGYTSRRAAEEALCRVIHDRIQRGLEVPRAA